MNNSYSFSYPKTCLLCRELSELKISLQVAPYYKLGSGTRLMLIGQDPTILKNPENVTHVLMLNQKAGQLYRWLKTLFGEECFKSLTLYATNLVKCTFEIPPSTAQSGGLKFLKPYFNKCQQYLLKEVLHYKPNIVLTLGEPTHKLFISLLDNRSNIPNTMQSAFTGNFLRARLCNFEFDYSPCLHIKTFRVAEVYGKSVVDFKRGLKSYFVKN